MAQPARRSAKVPATVSRLAPVPPLADAVNGMDSVEDLLKRFEKLARRSSAWSTNPEPKSYVFYGKGHLSTSQVLQKNLWKSSKTTGSSIPASSRTRFCRAVDCWSVRRACRPGSPPRAPFRAEEWTVSVAKSCHQSPSDLIGSAPPRVQECPVHWMGAAPVVKRLDRTGCRRHHRGGRRQPINGRQVLLSRRKLLISVAHCSGCSMNGRCPVAISA